MFRKKNEIDTVVDELEKAAEQVEGYRDDTKVFVTLKRFPAEEFSWSWRVDDHVVDVDDVTESFKFKRGALADGFAYTRIGAKWEANRAARRIRASFGAKGTTEQYSI